MSGQGAEPFEEPPRSEIPGISRQHVAAMEASDDDAVWVLAGMHHVVAADAADAAAQAGPGVLVELRGDRAANVRGHRELFRQVAERLGG